MIKSIQANLLGHQAILKKLKIQHYLLIYFTFLISIAPFQLRGADSYYYWDWSRHLDLSYFDGPPMIAYWIKAATLLFHDTLLGLATPMILSAALSTWILYQTARTFLTQADSQEAILFWLFSPLTTLDLLTQTTYDSPQTLFWICSLYYCMRFIQNRAVQNLYFIGISIGLLLISKYTGTILVLGLLVFVSTTPTYRYLLKHKHFYMAIGLGLLITSPVILWGSEHHWISFGYQLTSHVGDRHAHTLLLFFNYCCVYLNAMIVPPVLALQPRVGQSMSGKARDSMKLCAIMCFTLFLFYFLFAFKVKIHHTWLEPFLITSALLMPLWQHPIKKILLILNIIVSIIILLNGTFLFKKPSYYTELQSIKALNHSHTQLPNTVVTDTWLEARPLFFIKSKPMIYTLNCGQSNQNQYEFWSQHLPDRLKETKDFLYVSHSNQLGCLQQYSSSCTQWPMNSELIVYHCMR